MIYYDLPAGSLTNHLWLLAYDFFLDDGNVCLCLRYFMVLIQEMDLKLDLGFLYAILDLLTPENASVMTSEQEV